MKNLITTTAFVFCTYLNCVAQKSINSVNLNLAENVALKYATALKIANGDLKISDKTLYIENGDTLLFYFQVNKKASILIAGDKRVFPVLGYSDSPNEYKNDSPEFAFFIKTYINDLKSLKSSKTKDIEKNVEETWASFNSRIAPAINIRDNKEYGPYIPDNNWKQSSPFNDYGYLIGTQHAKVGCTPLALGMVCKYYGYPSTTTGTLNYTSPFNSSLTFSGDIATSYNYNEIPWLLQSSSTSSQKQETGKLLLNIGLATKSIFGVNSTGTETTVSTSAIAPVDNISVGAVNYLSFVVNMAQRNTLTTNNWVGTVAQYLINGKPLVFTGGSSSHSWVCDGYKSCLLEISRTNQYNGQYFNMKWGWGNNMGHNYYRLNLLTTNLGNFTNYQKIYVLTKP